MAAAGGALRAFRAVGSLASRQEDGRRRGPRAPPERPRQLADRGLEAVVPRPEESRRLSARGRTIIGCRVEHAPVVDGAEASTGDRWEIGPARRAQRSHSFLTTRPHATGSGSSGAALSWSTRSPGARSAPLARPND